MSQLRSEGSPIPPAPTPPASNSPASRRIAALVIRHFLTRTAIIGLLLYFLQGDAHSDITSGLLSHYSFENNTQDVSGNNNHATLIDSLNTSYSASGGVGAGLLLNGGAVEAKPDVALPHVTVSLWIRPNTVPAGIDFNADNWIVDGWKGRENYGIYLRGSKIYAAFHKINTGEIHVKSDALILAGTLYHIAMTFDGVSLKLYVNGTLQSDQQSSPGGDDSAGPTATDLRLGMNRSGTQRYQGLMDEFRLYDRALIAADLQTLSTPTYGQETRTVRLESISAVDSYVKSTQPNVALGVKPDTRTGGAGDESRFLLQFPTAGFPATISKATLFLFCKGNNNASAGNAPQVLYRPTTAWANNVTWNNQPAATQIAALPANPVGRQWLAIDITMQLSDWLAGGVNTGIELRSGGAANQENVFASLESAIALERPYLTIEYQPVFYPLWSDDFNGNALNPNTWNLVQGQAQLSDGVVTLGSPGGERGEVTSLGKKTFLTGISPVRFEFRARRVQSYYGASFSLEEGSNSITVREALFPQWNTPNGFQLVASGIFGTTYKSAEGGTAEWQEYQLTIKPNGLTAWKGNSLGELNRSLSQNWSNAAAFKNGHIRLSSIEGGALPALFDWVRVSGSYFIEGVVALPQGGAGNVIVGSGANSVTTPSLGNYRLEVFSGPQQIQAFLDENMNGNREPWEPASRSPGLPLSVSSPVSGLNIELSTPADGDRDGISDDWEVANGLSPSINDPASDLDGDGLPNIAEYRLQTQVGDPDTDGDGQADGQEINFYGTNPLLADTDSDGMSDGWESTNGLNPWLNDASDDRDLDGLTNKEEFDQRANGYKPNAPNSKAGLPGEDGISDYRRLKGEGWVRRAYDKNDRLIATERDNGLFQAYTYDGNSQKRRDLLANSLDSDGDGLPDAWEHGHGFAFAGAGAGNGMNGPLGDPDQDGFTNALEWRSGTDPQNPASNTHPGSGSAATISSIAAEIDFTPSKWVMATGRTGRDERIALDATAGPSNTDGKAHSFMHTCAGSNLILFVVAGVHTNTATVTGVTYNGVALSSVGTIANGGNSTVSLWYLVGPAKGAHEVVITANASDRIVGISASYTGVKQSAPLESSSTGGPTTNSSYSQAVTTVSDNCWAIMGGLADNGGVRPLTAGPNTVVRQQPEIAAYGTFLLDTGTPKSPAGVDVLNVTSGSQKFVGVMACFAPATFAGPSEVFLGADGSIGTTTNAVTLLSRNNSNWNKTSVSVGNAGINSIALGQPAAGPGVSMFLGNRPATGAGSITEYRLSANTWTRTAGSVAASAGLAAAQVIGYSASNGLISLLSPSGQNADAVYHQTFAAGIWGVPSLLDNPPGNRDWPIMIGSGAARWLDGGGIRHLSSTLPDPVAIAKLVWRGHSFTFGNLRIPAGFNSSLAYAFIDDKDTSSSASFGDDFVVGEYDVGQMTPSLRTSVRIPMSLPNAAGAYSLTILRRANAATPGTLAVGEPDGTVSLWTTTDSTAPLVRKVITTEFFGKAWNQMEPLREADGREGLVGLLVDPARPQQCQVIYWSPEAIETALNSPTPVLNNPPKARVLATPASGGSRSSVAVRIWDAEAHSSSLVMQYQRPGETIWNFATILSADGGSAASPLSSQPGGINHNLLWNAGANLGATFNGTVLLRTQATDAAAGEWSEPMPYTIHPATDLDSDGDGVTDWAEQKFGTNPADAASLPSLLSIRNTDGSFTLTWTAAIGQTYRIETSTDLQSWILFRGGLASNSAVIPALQISMDARRYYRVMAE